MIINSNQEKLWTEGSNFKIFDVTINSTVGTTGKLAIIENDAVLKAHRSDINATMIYYIKNGYPITPTDTKPSPMMGISKNYQMGTNANSYGTNARTTNSSTTIGTCLTRLDDTSASASANTAGTVQIDENGTAYLLYSYYAPLLAGTYRFIFTW